MSRIAGGCPPPVPPALPFASPLLSEGERHTGGASAGPPALSLELLHDGDARAGAGAATAGTSVVSPALGPPPLCPWPCAAAVAAAACGCGTASPVSAAGVCAPSRFWFSLLLARVDDPRLLRVPGGAPAPPDAPTSWGDGASISESAHAASGSRLVPAQFTAGESAAVWCSRPAVRENDARPGARTAQRVTSE